ncbi:hypothetical protein V8C40DRAFT_250187 [Trichoderma camerunense]
MPCHPSNWRVPQIRKTADESLFSRFASEMPLCPMPLSLSLHPAEMLLRVMPPCPIESQCWSESGHPRAAGVG